MNPTASLKRRLICMVYEAILLFGVFFTADFLFEIATQSYHESTLRHIRQLYLFLVIGVYFTYFWRHGGQTLPMQTWRIKVVSVDAQQILTYKQAWLRYCLAWMWFLPALGLNYFFGIKQWPSLLVLFIGIVAWACTVKLDKRRQFLHDKWAGTELVFLTLKDR
jgi:uncharacterized RDD family membrane protein YckC